MKSTFLPLSLIAILALTTLTSCGSSTSTSTTSPSVTTDSTSKNISRSVTYLTDNERSEVQTVFSVSINGDTLTAVNATLISGDHDSERYIADFNRSAPNQLVGKKISELSNISAVGGASDTTTAFKQIITNL